jgi:hypothetical protein
MPMLRGKALWAVIGAAAVVALILIIVLPGTFSNLRLS